LHQKLEKAPDLPEELSPFWQAYQELSGSRVMSEAIPISEINAYCQLYGIRRHDDISMMIAVINALCVELAEFNKIDSERKRKVEQMKANRSKIIT
jgi:hypothetical protein